MRTLPPGVAAARRGYGKAMRTKTMIYAALGWATWKFGKLYAKRKLRASTH
jgi:hypothetical protein